MKLKLNSQINEHQRRIQPLFLNNQNVIKSFEAIPMSHAKSKENTTKNNQFKINETQNATHLKQVQAPT